MPGMAYFLRNRLTTLPDIAGMWHLDYITGSKVIDSSKNLNHGTVYGATLVDGVIDHALLFDGIDDYVDCGTDPSLTGPVIERTIEFFLKIPVGDSANRSIFWWSAANEGFSLIGLNDSMLRLAITNYIKFSSGAYHDGKYHHWSLYIAGPAIGDIADCTLHIDTSLIATHGLVTGDPANPWNRFYFGKGPYGIADVDFDHLIVYDRPLTDSDRLRHSERRYPS